MGPVGDFLEFFDSGFRSFQFSPNNSLVPKIEKFEHLYKLDGCKLRLM